MRHFLCDAQDIHGQAQVVKHGRVIDAVQGVAATLVEVVVGLRWAQHESSGQLWTGLGSRGQLVEDVVVPLLFALEGDPGLLQEVVLHNAALDLGAGEADLHELAKAAGVVIADGFSIACGMNTTRQVVKVLPQKRYKNKNTLFHLHSSLQEKRTVYHDSRLQQYTMTVLPKSHTLKACSTTYPDNPRYNLP